MTLPRSKRNSPRRRNDWPLLGADRHKSCSTFAMVVLLGILGLSLASVGLLLREVRNAPLGYQDRSGFHVGDAMNLQGFKPRCSGAEKAPRAQRVLSQKQLASRMPETLSRRLVTSLGEE